MRRITFSLAALTLFACAPESGPVADDGAEDSDAALALPFVELAVSKPAAPPGFTVITKKADYKAFFGENPPADINFNKHWVLHYSMGVQNTGGYDANITSVERIGSGANARLVIGEQAISPGPMCFVTQAFTNPQVTVRISKQNKSIAIDQNLSEEITDCSEPNWCAAALCGPGTTCDELVDACVEEAFCPKVKCANGYECSEEEDACVPRSCDPDVANDCPNGMVCHNPIVCITWPCPADYRCTPAPADPCEGIGWEGTCEGTTLKYCDAGELVTVECAPYDCGWNSGQAYYDCL